ncbi:sensor histidine kinase [Rhodococcoides kyotonense]|uniref:Signal transduction histidine kinase n=1 Tax=Rhodococcoides kyotonense TaxID=398843 RepID=A0A239LAY4_9NOCA|nr:ATP-binding protein [Rhodococcus kyotonensis]SNT26714.1 Signal transduction histidine kinase [Rhodococcus kyotonensis]
MNRDFESATVDRDNTAEHSSSDRLLRTFARFIAAGYLIYLVMLFPEIVRTSAFTASWWTPVSSVAVFGTGLAMGLASMLPDTKWVRIAAATAAFTYLAAALSWWTAWNGSLDPNGLPLATFPGVAGLAAGCVFSGWLAFTYLTAAVTSVQLSQYALRSTLVETPLFAELVFGLVFCSVFLAATIGAFRTARILDATIDATHRQASATAAVSARAVERERFDALIHDGVLSTLLAVARQGRTDGVVQQAERTLAQLDSLRAHGSVTEFDADETVAHLRSAATTVDEHITVTVVTTTDGRYVADAVRTLGAALSEAVRNSVRHGGDDASRTVAIGVDTDLLDVVVRDDGSGFDPAHVPPHRLGIAVSIHGRMNSLPGGSSRLDSAPGAGTTVHLSWVPR